MTEQSKSMCMFPWVHTYVTPEGDVYPCCTAKLNLPVENILATNNTLKEVLMNNENLATIRKEMLAGNRPPECKVCWDWEDAGGISFRSYANNSFGHKLEHYVKNTNPDGTLNVYEPMYIDVRFSNICNLKCRMCSDVFSSAWAKEKKQYNLMQYDKPIFKRVDVNGNITQEILNYLDTVEVIYWGGGEPLLMEEHFVILEELNRRQKFDIELRYNTNTTNLQYKDKNFAELIKNFKRVEIQSSIDHYGKRSEWLRHGANWDTVLENIVKLKSMPNVMWTMNSVLTKWNVYTFDDFMRYIIDNQIMTAEESHKRFSTLPITPDPDYFTVATLPQSMIDESLEKFKVLKVEMDKLGYATAILDNAINQLATITSIYGSAIERNGIYEADKIDSRRGENWRETFPELAHL
jgi:radical SAM protein with 4Fe4S-binding SPASM domain